MSGTLNVDDSETNIEVAVVRGNQVLNVTLASPLEFTNHTIRINEVKTDPVTMTKVSFAVGQVQNIQLVQQDERTVQCEIFKKCVLPATVADSGFLYD